MLLVVCVTLLGQVASQEGSDKTSEAECTKQGQNTEWDNDHCYCKDGYLPNSYMKGGVPCLEKEKAIRWYCEEDDHSYWNVGKQECFCRDGFVASPDSESDHHMHPCVPDPVAHKKSCDADPNAGWDAEEKDCYCFDGFEPGNTEDENGFAHPCEKSTNEL